MKEPIWEGVYGSFAEVPSQGDGYECRQGMLRSLDRLAEARRGRDAGELVVRRDAPLPLIAAMLLAERGALRILDFGGGMGLTFLETLAGIPDASGLEYHVVELPNICDAARQGLAGVDGVVFHETVPRDLAFDVLHFGSSIHYVDDWKGLLASLLANGPRYVVFTDLPAGANPEYCTGQAYYGARIPVRFFNSSEFLRELASLGLVPVYLSCFRGVILGKEQPLPQENFEASHRVGDTMVIVCAYRGSHD